MARVCEDCYSAILSGWDDQLIVLHKNCIERFMEMKLKRLTEKEVPKVEVEDVDKAIQVVFARLLGATHRRIAELFAGTENQLLGSELVFRSEVKLNIPPGTLDNDPLLDRIYEIAQDLDWSDGQRPIIKDDEDE